MNVKRWCSKYAAGTETATMHRMVEAHGDHDEDTHYVLASDYDALGTYARTVTRLAKDVADVLDTLAPASDALERFETFVLDNPLPGAALAVNSAHGDKA